MKKLLCLLLTFVFLFSLAACRAAESETSNEPSTSAPAESTAPTESGDATEPEETEPEATTPEETEPPVPNIVDGLFVWNEAQFPTIKSIKIGPNTLTDPDPTEEEISNFLCQAIYYEQSLFFADCWATPYRIPCDETVTRRDNSSRTDFHPLDRSYIKNRQYMQSVVLESFFGDSYDLDELLEEYELLQLEDDMRDDIWTTYDIGTSAYDYGWDPSIINFVVKEKSDHAMTICAYVYYYCHFEYDDGYEGTSHAATEMILSLSYTAEGLWKIEKCGGPLETFETVPRDDFGTRLTIEKAD